MRRQRYDAVVIGAGTAGLVAGTRLAEQGASAAILGCTEFGLLVKPADVELPLYDTAQLHVAAAIDAALA